VLVLFGLGMTVGDLVGGRLADRSVTVAIVAALGSMIVVLVAFALTAHHTLLAAFLTFLLGAGGMATVPALQTRLMDVAADASRWRRRSTTPP
jgi:DHA1 family inner membrane transport protein